MFYNLESRLILMNYSLTFTCKIGCRVPAVRCTISAARHCRWRHVMCEPPALDLHIGPNGRVVSGQEYFRIVRGCQHRALGA